MPDKPPRIEIGSHEMRTAFNSGLEYYQPTFGGHDLFVEAGTTETTIDNLATISGHLRQPRRISVGKNRGVWIEFDGADTYLATGFSIGYRGTGPTGLAHFAAKCGFGKFGELIDRISALDQDFQGVLFEKEK